jgi:hypothetical protein
MPGVDRWRQVAPPDSPAWLLVVSDGHAQERFAWESLKHARACRDRSCAADGDALGGGQDDPRPLDRPLLARPGPQPGLERLLLSIRQHDWAAVVRNYRGTA